MKGKSRADRIALNRRARSLDRWIFWLDGISALLCVSILAVADWLAPRLHLREWFLATMVFAAAYLVLTVFKAAFVTPRIRRALAAVPSGNPGKSSRY